MARLSASDRAKLPDSAFAYVDSRGRRLLPINDEAHVRNALARFEQVKFESEAARERARKRLLNAAKKYRIVPVGFITGQLRTEGQHAATGRLVIELGQTGAPGQLEQRLRRVLRDPSLAVLHWSEAAGSYLDGSGQPCPLPSDQEDRAITYLERQGRPMTALVHDPAVLGDPHLTESVLAAVRFALEREQAQASVELRSEDAATLPTGFVTLMMTDIEGSTGLLRALGEGYGRLLTDVRNIIRGAVLTTRGREVEVRADEFFGVFERVGDAVAAAVAIQRKMAERSWPDDLGVGVRIGLHSGPITLTDTGYIGLAVHTAARVCFAGHGGQIVASSETRAAMSAPPAGIRFQELGRHSLAGMTHPHALFQVEAEGLRLDFPPLRAEPVPS
ncbi:MAG TPA: adenylate/guanylate cyclase domain-containing protein [Acidimicrobiia bacterium]|nr:adenylate/guanylate cyclase domain-containing protein [Acidimicrobiia bacterium]